MARPRLGKLARERDKTFRDKRVVGRTKSREVQKAEDFIAKLYAEAKKNASD